ncbi:MAG: DUF4386 domain-containing protein [Anaerolineales bacterium]|nr:DUF4386 domain-containing protein [Anaerolineales bacterium]
MSIKTEVSFWKSLYHIGAIAPLVAIVFYLTEMFSIILGAAVEPYPSSVEDWYTLFQHNKLIGLLYFNALDVFSIAFLGVMFLALYVALKEFDPSLMIIATFFALLGVVVFVLPRAALLAVLPLSDKYAAAATAAQRTQMLAAGEALNSLGAATPQTMGFFFMAVAVMVISVVMLRSESFSKATAYIGLVAGILTIADDLSVMFVPALASILMPVSGLFWLIWWVLVSRGLFRLARITLGESK